MSAISEFNAAANADTESEHQVQLGLLQNLCDSIQERSDPASIAKILDELIDYSEAHFVSEELLMRMKSYDDYEDHVADHEQMLEALRGIAAIHTEDHSSLAVAATTEALAFIRKHIATRDQRFSDMVQKGL
ncbi:MAG: hemerythrin family protein [Burkholderiaceae bacterium]|nr:hemerythrin family protein [Sulfuritalea sp.]MCF8176104.1 hemerythrin family protein [Burkholderiaceae bacterium]